MANSRGCQVSFLAASVCARAVEEMLNSRSAATAQRLASGKPAVIGQNRVRATARPVRKDRNRSWQKLDVPVGGPTWRSAGGDVNLCLWLCVRARERATWSKSSGCGLQAEHGV